MPLKQVTQPRSLAGHMHHDCSSKLWMEAFFLPWMSVLRRIREIVSHGLAEFKVKVFECCTETQVQINQVK